MVYCTGLLLKRRTRSTIVYSVKIKQTEIQYHREKLRKKQRDICPLCGCVLSLNLPSLDHDHKTGAIRGVLCRNCNQVEGRILAWITRGARGKSKELYLKKLLAYWRKHSKNITGLIHPTHGKPRKRRRRKRVR